MALPGWYSLFSVIEIHAALEAVAVVFFVALVVFDVWAHIDKDREHLLERIGLICFAVAVLGEVCAYPYSRRVATLSSEANAVLNKEAGGARREASEANERSKTIEVSNKQLGIDLLNAKSALERELQETAKAQKAAADAQKDLNRFLVSRVLNREVKPEMVESLKKLSPSDAEVWYRDESEEALIFAIRIRQSLIEAGWRVPKAVIPILPGRFKSGDLNFLSGVAIYTLKQSPSVPFATQSPFITEWHGIDFPKGVLMTAGMLALQHGATEPSEIDLKNAILSVGLDSRMGFVDASLPSNFFRIVIGERSSTFP